MNISEYYIVVYVLSWQLTTILNQNMYVRILQTFSFTESIMVICVILIKYCWVLAWISYNLDVHNI